jgi:hypothetical protein
MSDLDAGHRARRLDGVGNPGEAFDVFVAPDAASPGVIRPSGETAVASTITSPEPPRAMLV